MQLLIRFRLCMQLSEYIQLQYQSRQVLAITCLEGPHNELVANVLHKGFLE